MLQILMSFVFLMSTPTIDSSINPKTSKRMAIAKTAKSLVHSKYKYGGKTPKGFDEHIYGSSTKDGDQDVKDGKKKDLTNDAFMHARSNPEKLKEKIHKTIGTL